MTGRRKPEKGCLRKNIHKGNSNFTTLQKLDKEILFSAFVQPSSRGGYLSLVKRDPTSFCSPKCFHQSVRYPSDPSLCLVAPPTSYNPVSAVNYFSAQTTCFTCSWSKPAHPP
jgi:hypothetical protein